MRNPVPRIAAIHDMSGFGRTSLTVAIPILSCMGIQVCPMPTAVLSTHTVEFTDYTLCDLTPELGGILDHWERLGLHFDGVYSGFMASPEQMDSAARCIRNCLAPGGLAVVDPVLGDNGILDPTMTPEMVEKMRWLISCADIITPNITEVALLLDEPFSALDYKLRRAMQLEIKRLQRRLGITFVFVTHDQEEAFAMSDRVVVMNQGRIEQIGTPQEIYEEPSNLYVARFVGEINILPARIMSVPGEGIYIADISGRRFTLRTSRPFVAGDRVNVLLRPEDIRVYAHDDERPEGPYLTGRIEETVYKGATVDISIALDSGETLSVAEFFNEDDAEISYNRGERVAVTWVDGWEVVLPYEAD